MDNLVSKFSNIQANETILFVVLAVAVAILVYYQWRALLGLGALVVVVVVVGSLYTQGQLDNILPPSMRSGPVSAGNGPITYNFPAPVQPSLGQPKVLPQLEVAKPDLTISIYPNSGKYRQVQPCNNPYHFKVTVHNKGNGVARNVLVTGARYAIPVINPGDKVTVQSTLIYEPSVPRGFGHSSVSFTFAVDSDGQVDKKMNHNNSKRVTFECV